MPFQALPDGEQAPPEPRPKPPAPSKPGPAVRLIPREKPARRSRSAERRAGARGARADETAATAQADDRGAAPAVASRPRAPPRRPRSIRPEPGSGAARLLGEDAIVPLEQRGALEVWGPRLVAVVLVALLLIALALIVRGLL